MNIKKFSDINEGVEWNPKYNSESWKLLKAAIKTLVDQGESEEEIQTYLGGLLHWNGLNDDTL